MNINIIKSQMQEYSQTLECKQGAWRLVVTADILKLMNQRGINKAELAQKMETSKANVTMMLNGDRNLTIDKIYEIYHHLGSEPEIRVKPDKTELITSGTGETNSQTFISSKKAN